MPQLAVIVAVLVGCLVLVGWLFDIEALKRIVPSLVAMNPATAICFILAGIALWLCWDANADPRAQRAARLCAVCVALIGLLKLIGILAGWDAGIDQLLFHDKLAAIGDGLPNRMAPNTALNFVLLGLALLMLDVKTSSGYLPSQFIAIVAILIATVPIIGYAYGISSFMGIGSYIRMALHTAITFLVLLAGILYARPDQGLMATITSDDVGGLMARRLLPAAILIPAALGWLRLAGQRAQLYDAEVGIALLVVLNMLSIAVLIWWNAGLIHQIDARRKKAEDQRNRAAIALSLSHDELRQKNSQMEADLDLAHEIQMAFLPEKYLNFPRVVGPLENFLHFDHRYYPTSTLGGDFIDIVMVSDTEVGVFICDVMGHGVRSALVTAVIRGLVEELKPIASDPGQFLSGLNNSLIAVLRRTRTPMFASAFFVVADVANGQMCYANAGHPSPLHVKRGAGVVEPLCSAQENTGPALGVFEDFAYLTCQCDLFHQDLLMVFTDGLFEVEGQESDYDEEQLIAAVRRHMEHPVTLLFDNVLADIQQFSDRKVFEDDVCLVGMDVMRLGSGN
jgi:serine phosphatase RsbU (regulator of sigma subunit)